MSTAAAAPASLRHALNAFLLRNDLPTGEHGEYVGSRDVSKYKRTARAHGPYVRKVRRDDLSRNRK